MFHVICNLTDLHSTFYVVCIGSSTRNGDYLCKKERPALNILSKTVHIDILHEHDSTVCSWVTSTYQNIYAEHFSSNKLFPFTWKSFIYLGDAKAKRKRLIDKKRKIWDMVKRKNTNPKGRGCATYIYIYIYIVLYIFMHLADWKMRPSPPTLCLNIEFKKEWMGHRRPMIPQLIS